MTKPATSSSPLQNQVFVRGQAAKGVRNDTFQGKDFLVVPVIAIVEGVLQGMNSTVPEFASAQEFGKYPAGWNGRPVVMNHPVADDGEPISANSPEALLDWSFGQLFNTQLQGKKLKTEAWLDLQKAEEKGGDFADTVRRLQDGELVEVSVGIFVTAEPQDGTFNGKKFKAVWTDVVPDHLAFLSKGIQGACSNKDGCGAPRINEMRQVLMSKPAFTVDDVLAAKGADDHDCLCETAPPPQVLQRLLNAPEGEDGGLKTFKISDNLLDMDVYKAVSRALRKQHGNDVFLMGFTSSSAVYGLFDKSDFSFKTQQIGINVDDKANVKFTGEPQDVTLITQIINPTAVKGNQGVTAMAPGNPNPPGQEDKPDKDKPRNPNAADPADPGGPGEPATPATPAKKEPEVNPQNNAASTNNQPAAAAPPRPVTLAEYVEAAPPEMREVLTESIRIHKERKDAIIKALKATNRCKFTDEQLGVLSLADLENLSELAQVPTYEGRGAPREVPNVNQGKSEFAPLPPRLFEVKNPAA